MNFQNIKKIHFIGIGGIGVSAIARIFLEQKKNVSGSDLSESGITEELRDLGAKVFIGHRKDNISRDLDIVVYSPAVPEDNVELQEAKKIKVPVLSYPQILGQMMKNKFSICISGTHGKTTTTAMVSEILTRAGLDPTVVVGSEVMNWRSNARWGESKYFIVEACEYRRHFLNYSPHLILLTNIEYDHPDYYKDLQDVSNAFREFISKLPKDGLLIACKDSRNVEKILENIQCKIVTYGISSNAKWKAEDIKFENGENKFIVKKNNKIIGDFTLWVPGKHNVQNALGAIALASELNIPYHDIRKALENFKGTWRRFSKRGEVNNIIIIDDYAHHPTEIKTTLEATREFYPKKRIWCVFQPHQHARILGLFREFITSFKDADKLIISDIYNVPGREEKTETISSKDLVQEIKKIGQDIKYIPKLDKVKDYLLHHLKSGDVVICMGPGDIYKLEGMLVKELKCMKMPNDQ